MNPHPSEERLAILAGGDLPELAERSTREHLHACDLCRERLVSFETSRDWLRELDTKVEVPETDLAEVRQRVAQLLPQRRRTLQWKWLAVPALCALVSLFWWPRFHPAPVNQPLLTRNTRSLIAPPPMPPARVLVLHHPHRRRIETGLRSVTLLTSAGHPTVIRMTTADPHIVILLQSEERASSDE